MTVKKSVGLLKKANLKGKIVFVRVDLNVPLDDSFKITDDTRIQTVVPTIKYLMQHGARVILVSHSGFSTLATTALASPMSGPNTLNLSFASYSTPSTNTTQYYYQIRPSLPPP